MPKTRILSLRPVPSPDEAAVWLDDVHLTLGRRALLRGVSLGLARHGVSAILGPNGAGKSLTLRLIAGLLAPDEGHVRLAQPLERPGLVFQKPVLLRRSVRANLDHALRVAGMARAERPGRIAELLVMASLSPYSESPARKLSGGEQQRLQMARALAASPACLLLDEPTASLDPASTSVIETLIRQIANQGVKVVLVTHDRGQAERLADDVAFMARGRITEHRSAPEFFAGPQSAEAEAYLKGQLIV
ncbi:MAG: ATP-binding cassette domain-containing protein [Pseudomonadota bacterium]